MGKFSAKFMTMLLIPALIILYSPGAKGGSKTSTKGWDNNTLIERKNSIAGIQNSPLI